MIFEVVEIQLKQKFGSHEHNDFVFQNGFGAISHTRIDTWEKAEFYAELLEVTEWDAQLIHIPLWPTVRLERWYDKAHAIRNWAYSIPASRHV